MPPPVVFLPGLLEPSLIWQPAIDALGLRPGQYLAPELPGQGRGDTPAETRRTLEAGAWLDWLADEARRQFHGRRPMVVGHSSGGMLAIMLARRYPDGLESLVLVNALTHLPPASPMGNSRQILLRDGFGTAAFTALWQLWLSSQLTFERGFLIGAASTVPVPHSPAMRRHLQACDPMAVRETARWVAAADVTEGLAHVTAPTLALIGRDDPIVPPGHQLGILSGAPNAHARLTGGGHVLFAEAPDEIHRALAAWRALARRDSRARPLAVAEE